MAYHHRCSNERDPSAAILIKRDCRNSIDASKNSNDNLGGTANNQVQIATSATTSVHHSEGGIGKVNWNGIDSIPNSMLNAACGKIGSSPIINSKWRDLQQADLSLQE